MANRLLPGMWVGIGSVCKRNSDVAQIEDIIDPIRSMSDGLNLHGLGLKATTLQSAYVYDSLYSADSMAWSFAARKQGRNSNDWREAYRFARAVERKPKQMNLWKGPDFELQLDARAEVMKSKARASQWC
jgi:hypothetical protein